jgi:uncharacterized damage-inducible protein DinB
MREILSSIEGEWRRYKTLGEGAIRQLQDNEFARSGPGGGNSIAVIVWHVAGNQRSRFTDFLTADGEKAWRDRDSEFESRESVTHAELLEKWNDGWTALFDAIEPLNDEDLSRTVTIRGEKFLVHEALLRLVAHTSYHVGQIVYLAKEFRGSEWDCLSIPLGKSAEFNRNKSES